MEPSNGNPLERAASGGDRGVLPEYEELHSPPKKKRKGETPCSDCEEEKVAEWIDEITGGEMPGSVSGTHIRHNGWAATSFHFDPIPEPFYCDETMPTPEEERTSLQTKCDEIRSGIRAWRRRAEKHPFCPRATTTE